MIDATKLPTQEPQMRLRVLESGTTEPITLAEAKAHLRVVFDDEDDYIASLIVAARQMAEGKLNRTITQRVRERAFCGWGRMPLLKPPFVQIESVSYIDAEGNELTLESTDITVTTRSEPATVALAPALRSSPPRLGDVDEAVIVRYTAGYAPGEVPRPILQWMLLVIGSLYENRETIVAGVSVASIPEDFLKWLLQPYMVYE